MSTYGHTFYVLHGIILSGELRSHLVGAALPHSRNMHVAEIHAHQIHIAKTVQNMKGVKNNTLGVSRVHSILI